MVVKANTLLRGVVEKAMAELVKEQSQPVMLSLSGQVGGER